MTETDTTQPERAHRRWHGKTMAVVAGALVLGFAWAGTILAEGWDHGRGPMGGPMGGMMGGMMFGLLDGDGDGRVSRAELEAFRTGRLAAADRNGDGKLDQGEFEAFWLEVTRPMRIRAFQFVDADGDGAITATEIARPSDRMFSRLDSDGDGFVAPTDRPRQQHRPGARHDRD